MFRTTLTSTVVFLILSCAKVAVGQPAPPLDAGKTVEAVAAKAATGYCLLEGGVLVEGQRGSQPGRALARARFKFAAAPEGKSRLELQPADKEEYLLVSDGQKSWAFVPKLKQYTEEESSPVQAADEEEDSGSDDERDLAETFIRLIPEHLATFAREAQVADVHGTQQVKAGRGKEAWPVVRVLSKDDPRRGLTLTELTINPESLAVGRLVWSNRTNAQGEKTVLRMTVEFTDYRLGEPVEESLFSFVPPKNARRVDAVPIPGQTGSFLVNQPAPDFELKTLEGERVRLSELRGKPVVLNFWASWCGPCRRELPVLSDLYDSLKKKGLVVYGVNDQGKGEARAYMQKAALAFPTLDDSGLKAHRLYRVQSIPSMFVIDGEGKVVRFLRGAHGREEMLEALKAVGF